MAVIDVSTLETRYLDFCKGQELPTNSAILSGFTKAKIQKGSREQCSMQVFLDQLRDTDFPPLIHAVTEIDSSDIEAVDIIQESPCVLNGEYVLSLMHAVDQKLRRVDLHDLCLGKDFVRDLFHLGLSFEILNLRSSHVRKLKMVGKFMNLRTLNLDFSISITGFQEDCFNCMPNLMRISMCETRVSNLWTTSSSLSKLPSLVELRFQNCLCCNDTAACSTSSSETPNTIASNSSPLDHPAQYSTGSPSISTEGLLFQNSPDYQRELSFGNFLVDDLTINQGSLENLTEDSSDDSEVEFSRRDRRMGLDDLLSNMFPELHTRTVAENEVYSDTFFPAEDETILTRALDLIQTTDASPKKFVPHHPSPICFEKHYREYLVVSLPRLKVLDNLPITETERDMSNIICAQYYEFLPYNRQRKENLVSIMQERENGSKRSDCIRKSKHFYSRSISAAKVGLSAWPFIHPLSKISSIENEESKKFRPRQFEYHPTDPSLMVFGTLDGEIIVINHESGNVVGYSASGMLNSVLGLCWLKSYPSKLIAGSDNGSLQLYDVRRMSPAVTDRQCTANISKFDDFENLTSVHVNSTDDQFIASGYSKDVSLYDIGSGKKLQTFTNMHRGHINVVKFAHHSPSMFVTSSFDHDVKMWDLRERPLRPCYTASSSRGNVMVCFSPDDHYLLASAVDNEVRQLLAVDGRVNLKFEIASSGSSQNYTRSYYMNGRDYIISGSSDEQVVRVCCAQTGRRLRDIPLETTRLGNSMFVQSLRGDPFRDFHMSILAAYMRPSSKSEIIKMNLMSTSEHYNESSYSHNSLPYSNMGA